MRVLCRLPSRTDGELSIKPTSADMRSGASVPSPASAKFDHGNLDVNAANGGSRTLGARPKSQDPLRGSSTVGLFKSAASPPTSPRTTSTPSGGAPKLDFVLPATLTSPRLDGDFGGILGESDTTDEFGALIYNQEREPVTLLSEDDISGKALAPKDVAFLVEAATTVINAQGEILRS